MISCIVRVMRSAAITEIAAAKHDTMTLIVVNIILTRYQR